MASFKVTTPKNPSYSGVSASVKFFRGVAIVSPETVGPGHTVKEVLRNLYGLGGYVIEPIAESKAQLFLANRETFGGGSEIDRIKGLAAEYEAKLKTQSAERHPSGKQPTARQRVKRK